MTNVAPSPMDHNNDNPSEVGWQFVAKYYTVLNKQPNRLHCFYTKASTFIHGVEGEDGKPCHGQLDIHNKILSMGFQDCKVFIHSVDAQSSANGGITILVIGEMSNLGGPWRKFTQSFFLARQTNGYYVLNDMFRFLKEEAIDGDDVSDSGSAAAPEVAPAVAHEHVTETSPPPYESQPVHAPTPAPSAPAPITPPPVAAVLPVEEPVTVAPEPVALTLTPEPQPQTNGIHTAEPEPSEPQSPVEESPLPASAPLPIISEPLPPPAAPPSVAPPSPAPAPQQAPPAPAAPPAPKTWANLAAANSKKWGAAVATESRGTTEVPAAAITPTASGAPMPPPPHASSGQRAPGQHSYQHQHQHGNQREHPAIAAAQSVTTAQCFAKGVLEPVSQTALQNLLTARFGAIKELEIVRSKACAFLEFVQLDSAKKAIIASLPQSQGGEGGIRIDVGGEAGPIRISVETRKERGERPVSRPRGGAPPNGEIRGGSGFRGGRGGRGRGVPTPAGK